MLGGLPHLGEIFSLGSALLWAVAVILFRQGGRHFPPVALNLFKDVVGLGLFLLTLPLLGIRFSPAATPAGDWLVLLPSGALGIGLSDTLFFASLNRLGAAGSAIVDSLYSPFVVLVAALFLHEPVGPGLLVAMALMVGAILLGTEGPAGASVPHLDRGQLWLGVGLGAMAMLLMACSVVIAKPVLARCDPWWATTVRLIGGVALLAVQVAARRQHRADVRRIFRPGPGWRVTLPAALVGSYLAMIVWIAGMKLTHASVASVLNQASTLFVLVLAALFLREPLYPRRVLAICMGFAAGVIVVG